MTKDCGALLLAAFTTSGPVPALLYTCFSPKKPCQALAPLLILHDLLPRSPPPITHFRTLVQVRCVLWCPPVTPAAGSVHLPDCFHPLCLRALVCHHICQSPHCPARPVEMCWRRPLTYGCELYPEPSEQQRRLANTMYRWAVGAYPGSRADKVQALSRARTTASTRLLSSVPGLIISRTAGVKPARNSTSSSELRSCTQYTLGRRRTLGGQPRH